MQVGQIRSGPIRELAQGTTRSSMSLGCRDDEEMKGRTAEDICVTQQVSGRNGMSLAIAGLTRTVGHHRLPRDGDRNSTTVTAKYSHEL